MMQVATQMSYLVAADQYASRSQQHGLALSLTQLAPDSRVEIIQ